MSDLAIRVGQVLSAASLLMAVAAVVFDLSRRAAQRQLKRELPVAAKVIQRRRQRRDVVEAICSRALPGLLIMGATVYAMLPLAVDIALETRFAPLGFDELLTAFMLIELLLTCGTIWMVVLTVLLVRRWLQLRT